MPRSIYGCGQVNVGSDYSDEERDFMVAMDTYKRLNGRTYPTWREVLAVLRSRGWRKVAERVALPTFRETAPGGAVNKQ